MLDGHIRVVADDMKCLDFKMRLHGIDAPACGMPHGLQALSFLAPLVVRGWCDSAA